MSDNSEKLNIPNGEDSGYASLMSNSAVSTPPTSPNVSGAPFSSAHNGDAPLNQSVIHGDVGSPEGSSSTSRDVEQDGNISGLSMKLEAGITFGSPASRKRAASGNKRPEGVSVTTVIKSSEGDVPTVSTSVMKAPGGAKGAAVRRSFTTQPGTSCEGNCLITISGATPKGSDQLNKKEPPKKQEQIKPNVDSLKPIARPDPHNSDAFDIFVKNVDGKVHTFSVKRNDSVDSLLLEVQKRLMLCQDQFWLNCNSKKLQRGHTLEEYRVVKHSTVYLLMPLVGGRM